MLQNTNSNIFPRLILGFVAIGFVTVLASLIVIKRIDNDVNAAHRVYEQALYHLQEIQSVSDQAAQRLFGYLLSGFEEELTIHRELLEALPAKFDTFASAAMLATPGEESPKESFLIIKQNWQDFARKAEIVIVDFQTNGIVSQAKLLAAEESLHQYQSLIDQLLEYEHTRSQVAGLQFSQIIDDSHLILLTSALVGLIALIMIATLMTKQVKTLLDTQERASEMQKNARVEQDRLAAELIQFIDTANAPIFGIDTKGQVNEWNQKAAVLTQFSKDEVMGRGLVAEFITEEYKDSVGQVLGQALQGTETANFEFPLYTKKGRRLEVLLNATTRRDIDNNIIGVIGVGQDITEQKNARVEQDRLAVELIQFIDTANAPIFGIDTKGQVNEWNQKAAVLTQFSKDEVMGRGLVAEFITEEYKDSVGQVLGQALQGTETANFEFPLYTKKGRRLEVLLNATTRRDIDNNIIGVIGVGQDITELKNARVAEDQLAKELTQFINTANAPIFGIDAQGRINEWNQTAAKITGYKKEDVLGENLVQEFITEDYRESVKAVLESALLGIETSNYEFPLYTNLGVRLDLLLNATTRRDTDGEIVGVIGVGQDISEVKRAQAALRQAQKMEVVGQLTGGLAHDFNNLLTVISGNLNFLVDELDVVSTDVAEIIDDAQSAAKDGAELTHRLLAFARQQVLEPQETLVNDLILDTSRLMSRTLGEDIKISTALDSENPVVMVDQSQLESALMNLCINSRDAMQSGGSLAITSETTSIDQSQVGELKDLAPGKYVVISVEDGGTGMSEKQIEQVFEPFYTTKEPGKGSGLGLSMVHGFVTQSRGTVVIESEQGAGSKIKLYLPEVTASNTTLPPSIETTFSNRVASGREKILVVDDEPRVRKTAVRVLRKLGYEVIEAASGDEALASMEKNKDIDLLFSDIMMPGGMNGRELASIVTKKYPKVKIQLTSGYENVDVTRNSIDAALPLLKKPYDREQLSIALRKQLDGRP